MAGDVSAVAPSPSGALAMLEVGGATALIYLFLIVALRLVARRQLGQLTVVDLVVVLVLGSSVETAMIHGNTSLPAGLVSAGTLLVLNRLLTWLFLRSRGLSHLVNGGPVLLVHDGQVIDDHLRRVGMTSLDVLAALRGRGFDGTPGVGSAVLETDGTVTVVPEQRRGPDSRAARESAWGEPGPARSGRSASCQSTQKSSCAPRRRPGASGRRPVVGDAGRGGPDPGRREQRPPLPAPRCHRRSSPSPIMQGSEDSD